MFRYESLKLAIKSAVEANDKEEVAALMREIKRLGQRIARHTRAVKQSHSAQLLSTTHSPLNANRRLKLRVCGTALGHRFAP